MTGARLHFEHAEYAARIAERGLRKLLIHAGILAGEMERAPSPTLDMPSDACFVASEGAGPVEPCVDLGEDVRAGQVLVRVHDPARSGAVPVEYRAGIDGILAGRHFPGLTQSGDCLAVVAVPRA